MAQKILTISAGGILTEVNDAYQGTVTSVAALTLGTTGTDLSSTVAGGTGAAVITLNVPTASATNRGVLSTTDWSAFSAKQASLGFTPINKAGDSSIGALSMGALTTKSAASGTYAVQVLNSSGAMMADFYDAAGSCVLEIRSSGGAANVNINGTLGTATFASSVTASSLITTPVAFASLPAGSAGMRAFVNNNSAGAAFGSAANGSGAVTYPVYHDGTSWKVG